MGWRCCILARSNLKLDGSKAHTFKSFEFLEVMFRSQNVLLRTVVIYRPPESSKNKATKSDFFVDVSSLLEIIVPSPGFILIGGDFNLHLGHHESCISEKFFDLLESRCLSQHVTEATHIKWHILDLLITRASDQVINGVHVSEDLVSDHNLVQFGINLSRPPNTRSYSKFNSIDCADFNVRLQSTFSNFLTDMGPDGLCDFYNQSITDILNEVVPMVIKTVIEKPCAAWYLANSDELIIMRRMVRQCESKWRTTRLAVHRDIFVVKRLEYARRCDELKGNYHRNRIEASDMKGLFAIVDELTGSKKSRSLIKPIPTLILISCVMFLHHISRREYNCCGTVLYQFLIRRQF